MIVTLRVHCSLSWHYAIYRLKTLLREQSVIFYESILILAE